MIKNLRFINFVTILLLFFSQKILSDSNGVKVKIQYEGDVFLAFINSSYRDLIQASVEDFYINADLYPAVYGHHHVVQRVESEESNQEVVDISRTHSLSFQQSSKDVLFNKELSVKFISLIKEGDTECASKGNKRKKIKRIDRAVKEYCASNFLVHYDFSKERVSGNKGKNKVFPFMRKIMLLKENSPKDYGYSKKIEDYKDATNLYHVLQRNFPGKISERSSTIEEVGSSEPPKKITKEQLKEVEWATSHINNTDAYDRLLSYMQMRSCLTPGSTMLLQEPCYQDDLLGTDCSTKIVAVEVTLGESGQTEQGVLIMPLSGQPVLLFGRTESETAHEVGRGNNVNEVEPLDAGLPVEPARSLPNLACLDNSASAVFPSLRHSKMFNNLSVLTEEEEDDGWCDDTATCSNGKKADYHEYQPPGGEGGAGVFCQ